MKILFTGASSFTGTWFVKTLISKGHNVVCPLRGAISVYQSRRKNRIAHLQPITKVVENAPFGSEAFLEIAVSGKFDVLCHHAANVSDYRSPNFDIYTALYENSRNLKNVLAAYQVPVVLTGSIFEQDEGVGDKPLSAFSPYGLSKGLTYQLFRYFCHEAGVALGKFVIPNPFGAYEEQRFTYYLMKCWSEGKIAEIKTGKYLRDNIPVDLLALAYEKFVVECVQNGSDTQVLNPSGYIGSQLDFVKRVAGEVSSRTEYKCLYSCEEQVDFPEPIMRVNSDSATKLCPEWNEARFWDEFVNYYRELF